VGPVEVKEVRSIGVAEESNILMFEKAELNLVSWGFLTLRT
jgi:hypothetical protein